MNGNGPTNESPRAKPGTEATSVREPVSRSTVTSTPRPDSSSHSRPSCHRGEWGMHMPRLDELTRRDVDEDTAVDLVLAPAVDVVAVAERGDEPGLVVDDTEAVEVAPVLGGERGDERRSPARHEAVLVVDRRQAREPRVHDPELVADVREVVDPDVARGVRAAGHEARVVALRRPRAVRSRRAGSGTA